MLTPTVAEIKLAHLRHNTRLLQERAGTADFMGVVKANAYGHGAPVVARTLRDEGVRHFAVARIPEAVELRAAGIEEPILVFAAPLPEHLPAYAEHDLDVTVSSKAVAEAVVRAARQGASMRVHVKVETGMGRLGEPPERAAELVRQLAASEGVSVAGLWTHFATSDDPDQLDFARAQLRRLQQMAEAVDVPIGHIHAANSGALFSLEESVQTFDPTFVRAGLALYGLSDTPELTAAYDLRPVMRLTSRVTHLKTIEAGTSVSYGRTWTAPEPVRLATVGVGYGDGYLRLLSNRAEVGLHGRRFPVVGTVCMDLLMVNLGSPETAPPAEIGDEVVLFGHGGPSAYEVAQWAETISYEVVTRVAERVPRIYRSEPGS